MFFQGHFLKLKATLFLASADEIAAVQESRLNQADKTKLTRDHNGFRKLLLVLTKSGKLLALHTGDGRIVWSLLIPGLHALSWWALGLSRKASAVAGPSPAC